MSEALKITLEGQLPEPLQRVIAERGGLSATALQGVGAAAAKAVRENFRSLPGNKLGGKRHFWAGAVKGTSYSVQGGEVTVSTNQIGVRQRLRGGEIRPKAGKQWLVFPVRAESYGKTVFDFGYVAGQKTSKEVRERLDTLFARARRVVQQPNPDVLPSADTIGTATIGALMRHFRLKGGPA